MAWCPKCESEYEDYVKVCKTCNVDLVADLSEVVQYEYLYTVAEAELDRSLEYLRYSGFDDVDVNLGEEGYEIKVPSDRLADAKKFFSVYVRQRQEELAKMTEEEEAKEEVADEEVDEIFEYINAPEKEVISEGKVNDLKSSALTFILLGGVIFAFGLIHILQLVSFIQSMITNVVLLVVGVIMIAIGIATVKKIPRYQENLNQTEGEINKIVTWFFEKYTLEQFYAAKEIDAESLDEGALYFVASEALREELRRQFMDQDLSVIQAAIDQITASE